MEGQNKLERLFLASFLTFVYLLHVLLEPTLVENLMLSNYNVRLLTLLPNIRQAFNKHSSLFRSYLRDKEKSF